MKVSVTEVRNRLSHWLREVPEGPVTITRQGKPVGVLISPEEHRRLRQANAYLEMLDLPRTLQDRDITAAELAEASRAELEARP